MYAKPPFTLRLDRPSFTVTILLSVLFNSLHFLVYFPIVAAVYFLLPHRVRWAWLLAASYYFYMCWKPAYVAVIWLLTIVDYIAGRAIGAATSTARRRLYLGLSLASNLGLLFFFKYFNFVNDTLRTVTESFDVIYGIPELDIILPLGISFHTFQALNYTIDVYRREREPERHLGRFALFIAFFPQLVAGPIERAGHLLPQFLIEHRFDPALAASGLRLMLWGFFKKLVIADRLAVFVNAVYEDPSSQSGLRLLLATYAFAYQIYCDFSGYSDIAVGAARVLGFDLTRNFERPYFATSIGMFWRRWHISLSTWFRDYVFIPLGGSRAATWRLAVNLMIVFLVSGLWHGANWTYILWGGLHGAFMVAAVTTIGLRHRLWAVLGGAGARIRPAVAWLVTFHLVAFAWIAFRATSVADIGTVVTRIAGWADPMQPLAVPGFDSIELVLAIAFILALESVQVMQERGRIAGFLGGLPSAARLALYAAAALVILLFGRFDEREFIYFQF